MPIFKKMSLNDKGSQIKVAQELLKKAGSTIKVTGVFSIGMLSAVRAFQKKNSLKVTGVIDNATWKKLMAIKTKKNVKMAGKK